MGQGSGLPGLRFEAVDGDDCAGPDFTVRPFSGSIDVNQIIYTGPDTAITWFAHVDGVFQEGLVFVESSPATIQMPAGLVDIVRVDGGGCPASEFRFAIANVPFPADGAVDSGSIPPIVEADGMFGADVVIETEGECPEGGVEVVL